MNEVITQIVKLSENAYLMLPSLAFISSVAGALIYEALHHS